MPSSIGVHGYRRRKQLLNSVPPAASARLSCSIRVAVLRERDGKWRKGRVYTRIWDVGSTGIDGGGGGLRMKGGALNRGCCSVWRAGFGLAEGGVFICLQ